MKQLSPQAQQVLRHMVKFGSITNVEAHAILKCRSVSRRITEIDQNTLVHFKKERKKDPSGQRYVRYSLYSWQIPHIRETYRCYL